MSEKPPRPINPVEDTSSTVPPTESTPETQKPAGAEFEPATATKAENGPKVEKPPRAEEAFFENFFNKRNRDSKEFEEWFKSTKKNIDMEPNSVEKSKHLKKLEELKKIVDNLPATSATAAADRKKAERALRYLDDKNMVVLPDVEDATDVVGKPSPDSEELSQEPDGEAMTPEPEMANGPTEPIPTPHTADKAEAQDEKTKIYDDPNQDPAVQETESRATRIANERIEAKRAQGSNDADSFDFGMRMHNLANMQAWDTFATLFPQKAAAYKDKIEGLKDALGRKADREEMDARDAAKASKKADPKVGVPPIDQTTGATGSKTSAGSKKKEKAPEPPDVFEPLPSTDPSDWEAILGVSSGATKEELRNAYRRLSQKYHPDKRNGHPQRQQFEEAFKVVNAAYANAQGKGKKSRYAPPPPSSSSGSTQTGGHAGGHGAPPPPSGSGRGPRAAGGGPGGPTGTPPPPPGAGGPTPSGAPKAARGPGKPKTPGAEEFKVFSEKFQSDLKISEKDLKTIPGYEDLTFGQRALVQERFKQVMLGKIREDANSERKEQQANAGRLGKFVGEFLKTRRIAELEKAVAGKLSEGGIDMHRATLEQLVAATKANKDEASFDAEGGLDVSYTSGLKAENPEQARQAALFDEAASKLSQIPSEWGAESATRAQKAEYEKTRKEYDTLRARVLFMKQAQTGNDVESMLWMNGVDERVRFDQLISTSPKVAEEMQSIQNPKLWTKIIQNVGGTERLGYFVGGGVTRALTVSLFGMVGAPVLAGLMGGWQARKRAQGALRESDQLARRGVKDTKATALNMLDVTKNKTATKLEKLAQQVVQETDPAERGKLIASLRERIKYTQEKLESGKLNFGTFSERIKNQLDLSQALGHASVVAFENAADTDADHEARLSKELDQYLDSRQGTIAGERADAVWEATKKGAKISAGFGLAGYLVSNFMHGGNTVDGLFDSKTADVAHQGAGGGIPHVPEQGGGSSVSDAISAQESTPNHPAVTELVAGGGKSAEGMVTTLEIGNRGPEGSIIDYFKDHQDIAKKFGWDGNGDIKKWAGTKAHALWLEHASKALENDEVKESLAKLGYTNDLEGYTKMMTRIKSGGVALDIQHKGVTLSGMEYLNNARSVAPASGELIEKMDFEPAPFEGAQSAVAVESEVKETLESNVASGADIEASPDVVESESVQGEVDDSQSWKTKEPVLHAEPVDESQVLDTRGMSVSDAVVERMNHDLTEVLGPEDKGREVWDKYSILGARRFQNLSLDPEQDPNAVRLQDYLKNLEARSGVRPRARIFWFNQTVDEYIRLALKTIEQKSRS